MFNSQQAKVYSDGQRKPMPIERGDVNGTSLHIWQGWNDKCIRLTATLPFKPEQDSNKFRRYCKGR